MRKWAAFPIIIAMLFALVGCRAGTEDPKANDTEAATPSAQLVPLDASGRGSLEGVGITPSEAWGSTPGSPGDRARQRGLERVQIRVSDTLGDVETYLVVPMFYDESTTYSLRTGQDQPVPLWSAIASETVTWWGSAGADVTYHESDGVLVLDTVVSSLAH